MGGCAGGCPTCTRLSPEVLETQRGNGRQTTKDVVRDLATTLILAAPEGLRYADLEEEITAKLAQANPNTIRGALYDFSQNLPASIVKPSRGFYRDAKHADAADGDVVEPPEPPVLVTDVLRVRRSAGRETPVTVTVTVPSIPESAFYEPFADWLMNQVEECTRAIPLGGSVFRDKWGTPDVIGVREPRKSHIVKFRLLAVLNG